MISKKYKLAITPQLGVNDKSAIVIKWYVDDGDQVTRGQPLCCLETTKATVDVESEFDGIFKSIVPLGGTVDINQPLGVILTDRDSYNNLNENFLSNFVNKSLDTEKKFTAKALRLANELGVDIGSIQVAGIIREKDVEYFALQQNLLKDGALEINLHPTRKNVAIYGSGNGAYTIFENINLGVEYHVVCFLDDDSSKTGEKAGLPILHSQALTKDERFSKIGIALGVADSGARRRIFSRCQELGLSVINVIHPLAWVAPSVKIGCGNHIKAGSIIDTRTEIRDGCIIDNNATIPHDNLIESFSHLAPGVILGSNVVVGEGTIVGIGASVATGVRIGANCIVAVGSAVTKNIPNGSVVEGVPARVIGQRRGGD